jgi:hypothetical protein
MRTKSPMQRPTAAAPSRRVIASLTVIDQPPEVFPDDDPSSGAEDRSELPDEIRFEQVSDHLLNPTTVRTPARVTTTAAASATNPNWSASSDTSDGPEGAGAVWVTVWVTVTVGSGVGSGVAVAPGPCVAGAVGTLDGAGEVIGDGSTVCPT